MKIAVLGVLINILGALLMGFGYAILKLAHNKAQEKAIPFYKEKYWWLGFLCVILAQPCYISCTSMANQSTLSVVGPIGLIINVFFSHFILHEKITLFEVMGICLFVPGIIFTLYFASMKNSLYNVDEFNEVFYREFPLIFLFGNLVILAVLNVLSIIIVKEHGKPRDQVSSSNYNTEDHVINDNKGSFNTTDDASNDTYRQNDSAQLLRPKIQKGMFSNPKWKLLPLIVFPYTGAFFAALSGGIVRAT